MRIKDELETVRGRRTLTKLAGLSAGVITGGVIGPIVFNNIGLNDPASAASGAVSGGAIGYSLAVLYLLVGRRDDRITHAVLQVLNVHPAPIHNPQVTVNREWVTLEGEVDYDFQKIDIERAVSTLPGVKGVTNKISVRTPSQPPTADIVKREIEEAFVRFAELDARSITVEIQDSKIILQGTVHSEAEAAAAEAAARAVPGIRAVANRLHVVREPLVRRK